MGRGRQGREHHTDGVTRDSQIFCGCRDCGVCADRGRTIRCPGLSKQGNPDHRALHAGLSERHHGAAAGAAAARRLDQPVVIDNKPGGGTRIGSKAAANAPADGHTLLFSSSALVIEPA